MCHNCICKENLGEWLYQNFLVYGTTNGQLIFLNKQPKFFDLPIIVLHLHSYTVQIISQEVGCIFYTCFVPTGCMLLGHTGQSMGLAMYWMILVLYSLHALQLIDQQSQCAGLPASEVVVMFHVTFSGTSWQSQLSV